MKIAVIVIAYNEEKCIGACIKAIQKQVPQPDEIIIVDNNSTDETAEIARSLGAHVISEKKQGMIYARNAGFDAATADILGRIDADTILLPGWVARAKKRFEEKPIIGLSGPVIFYDFLGGGIFGRAMGRVHRVIYFWSTRKTIGHNVLFGSNMAIRKDVWLAVKNEVCLDGQQYHEDGDLTAHISRLGEIAYDTKLMVSISARRIYDVRSLFHYAAKQGRTLRHIRKINAKSSRNEIPTA